MVEPLSLAAVILGIITSVVVIVGLGATIIKFGIEAGSSIKGKIKNGLYDHIDILKSNTVSLFIGICMMYLEQKKKIKCSHWQAVTVSDNSGRNKLFAVPQVNTMIELTLENNIKIVIKTLGDGFSKNSQAIGFRVYYKEDKEICTFFEKEMTRLVEKDNLAEVLMLISKEKKDDIMVTTGFGFDDKDNGGDSLKNINQEKEGLIKKKN